MYRNTLLSVDGTGGCVDIFVENASWRHSLSSSLVHLERNQNGGLFKEKKARVSESLEAERLGVDFEGDGRPTIPSTTR